MYLGSFELTICGLMTCVLINCTTHNIRLGYMVEQRILIIMKKQVKQPQINKNNKKKPENLMKKEYAETYEKLKSEIRDEQS